MRKKLIALSVALLTIGGSLTFTTAARASDSVLMDTGLRWCANCYDGWGISAGESNWIAFQFTATSAARITEMQFYMDATMSAFDGTTVGIYRDFTSAPKDPANLVGTLTFDGFDADPNVPSGFSGAASFTGSIDIPTAGTYWLKFGGVSEGNNVHWDFGGVSGAEGDWLPTQGADNSDFFDGGIGTALNYYPAMTIIGQPLTPALTLPPDFLAPKTYGNPASVTGTAPAAPAVALTPTAPVITAGATSVIYNGVPQSATYSVDQESSCSTTYNGSAIAPVAAGTYAVSITCSANSLTSTATTTLTITKASPVISWSTPGAITSTTKLGASQLNAFSYIPGSFTYSPAIGSTLPAGDDLVTATFTPTDSTNYTTSTMTVTIHVTP